MEIITKNAEETKELARKIADRIISRNYPIIVALTGDLGTGKTTFTQGLASGLGIQNKIISPTFILMRSYKILNGTKKNFYHLDLYRLEDNIEKEIENLGVGDVWKDPKNIIAIEWAEKAKKMIPDNAIWIKFENLEDDLEKLQ